MSASFDLFTAPLAGVNLIEASAGTGKTWNICGIYMRLLLERSLAVSQILVVTFTNSATAELRDRVRSRITETLRYLQGSAAERENDLAARLVQSAELAGVAPEEMVARLDLALQSFDEAAIFTIHGFCQRALAEAPFAAGAPFTLELLPDDEDIDLEVAQDFWRRHVADIDCHPAFAAHLTRSYDSPEEWAKLLRRRIARPLARLEWPDDIERLPVIDSSGVEEAFVAAKTTWLRARDGIASVLGNGIAALNGNRYRGKALAQSFIEWDAYFAAGNMYAPLDYKDSRLALCRASTLGANTNKGQRTPTHAFCDQVEALFVARECLDRDLALARLRVIRALLEWGPGEVRLRKRGKRVLGYDDILFNLYDALHGKEGSAALAGSLRARFPAALIDEFQDTDPVQFGIFRAIYASSELPVFLVGDPKQAIYGFRNADLHAYLDARKLARHEYTLDRNQRSTGDLIDTVNALFHTNGNAFVLEGLAYRDVYQGARRRAMLQDTSSRPRTDATIWLLPHEPEHALLPRRDAFDAAVKATCGEISRLLREACNGSITLDGDVLAPRHIAVLVRSHAHGTMIRNALRELDIGSVELAQESVFATRDAEEVQRVLLAVLQPGRVDCVKGALATELLGFDATAIEALAANESGLVAEMDAFVGYRETWLKHGFGVMYRRLLSGRGVSARMLARPDGERRLTNLLHLGELLHDAAELNPAPDALVRWLHGERADPRGDDPAQLRLESDRNLVQIVTIHKSKGLEYPIVFCPFLWDGMRRGNKEWPCTYHDRDGDAVLDFRDEDAREPSVKAQLQLESLAETMRLMYVGLTRASHRLYLIAGCYAQNRVSTSANQSTRSLLNWLIAGDGTPADAWCDAKSKRPVEEILGAWEALAERCRRKLTLSPLPVDAPERLPNDAPAASTLSARTPPRVPSPWRISSYTGLSLDAVSESAAMDHDMHVGPVPAGLTPPPDLPDDDILKFPRGPLAGECLHAALEAIDFVDAASWPQAIDRAIAGSPYRAERGRLAPMVKHMIGDVLATSLHDDLRLADVPWTRRLTELEFSLRSGRLSATALNALLARRGYEMPRLSFADLEGYLKGFVDVIVEHAGRYYIVDWKSNHLGYTAADYARPMLDRAMAQQGYHLQHLLYTVALHRYLARRVARYTYRQHFGGVAYLFVRGVRPDWNVNGEPAGVWFHAADESTIDELDQLFGHHEVDA